MSGLFTVETRKIHKTRWSPLDNVEIYHISVGLKRSGKRCCGDKTKSMIPRPGNRIWKNSNYMFSELTLLCINSRLKREMKRHVYKIQIRFLKAQLHWTTAVWIGEVFSDVTRKDVIRNLIVLYRLFEKSQIAKCLRILLWSISCLRSSICV